MRSTIERGATGSVILWGPAGCGKTSLAQIIAKYAGAHLEARSAVTCGVKDIREIALAARVRSIPTLLFLDEIHHFSRTQQDALLEFVEDGTLTLIGATTENPTFSLANPLLSRCRVLVLRSLDDEDIRTLVRRAAEAEEISLSQEAEDLVVRWANGDARVAMNGIEYAAQLALPHNAIGAELVAQAMNRPLTRYDAKGDQHYDVISAFIKSVRGSDVDAALHYLARMIRSGEDPRFIARRIVILASEDIGNANPMGLVVAMAAFHAVERIGMPESRIILAQATVFLAASPKSNSSYLAIESALSDLDRVPAPRVPDHLRDPNTKRWEDRGISEQKPQGTYKYPHDFGGWVEQDYLPPGAGLSLPYYVPVPHGYEQKLKAFLDSLGAGENK
ncbi:MAG: putative AAA domain-containing protein [Fimbriimonadales bacterium]|nr:putative AAA domain-containing protein [Fimbriimonadales bacterium]